MTLIHDIASVIVMIGAVINTIGFIQIATQKGKAAYKTLQISYPILCIGAIAMCITWYRMPEVVKSSEGLVLCCIVAAGCALAYACKLKKDERN